MAKNNRFKRIYIEITNACNLSCTFCQETKRPAGFMSTKEFEYIIQEIKPYTDYVYLHVKGEPLLHPDLEKILEICETNQIRINITTNGTLIRKRLEVLTSNDVHQMNISMHSADDNSNIDLDKYIEDLFYSCNVLNEKTNTEISLRLWNTQDKPNLFGQSNCRIKEHLYVNVRSPFEWPDIQNAYTNENGFCQGLRTHLAILCDGTVVPCCLDGNGVIELGNIFKTHLTDILSEKRSTDFINHFRNRKACEDLCIHCSYKERFNK